MIRDKAVLLLGVAAAACTSTQPPAELTRDEFDQAKWVICLREQGLEVDDPNPADPGGGKARIHEELVTPEKLREATDACRRYNPNFGRPVPPDPAQTEQLRLFAVCMREHGFDWDDPGGETSTPEAAPQPTPSGPQFDKAIQECSQRIPGVIADEPGGKK